MLLYTRLAPPKQPKRRSRGGCTYCKEKKKKCDEGRPKCGRCVEHSVECSYEAVRPRQRRRRESAPLKLTGGPSGFPLISRRFSAVSHFSHDTDYFEREDGGYSHLPYALDDPVILSPSDSTFDGYSFSVFSPTEFLDSHEADVASEDGHTTSSTAVIPRPRSLHPDLAMIAPCPVGSPLLDFCSPTFAEFSDKQNRRALVDHFCNVLSHLIVFREETGNPFQQLVLPLTRQSSPVTYAMFALACAHLEYRGVENAENSLYFHNMAIRGVSELLQNSSKVSRNEVLAAIMLLVYYECLVQKGQSNIVAGHLKGALTIMGSASDPADSTTVFLERAFRFYDVITALSNGTAPLSAAPTPGCLQPLSPLGAPSASPLCNVDTLLGMATTLWPIIHRLAGLRPLKTELETAARTGSSPAKVAVLRTEFDSTAQAIETALLQWQPQLPPGFIPDDVDSSPATDPNSPPIDDKTAHPEPNTPSLPNNPRSSSNHTSPDRARIASIHHNALAYRHASLVYLYRTVRARPCTDPAVQDHAHLALAHCIATVNHKGPMSALLWPLFVSACEAVTPGDRRLAEKAFAEVAKRQGMRNIDRAWGIVREVWGRAEQMDKDVGLAEGRDGVEGVDGLGDIGGCGGEGGEEIWRRVSREMGVSIVFG